jgi:hypothetical protein
MRRQLFISLLDGADVAQVLGAAAIAGSAGCRRLIGIVTGADEVIQ